MTTSFRRSLPIVAKKDEAKPAFPIIAAPLPSVTEPVAPRPTVAAPPVVTPKPTAFELPSAPSLVDKPAAAFPAVTPPAPAIAPAPAPE